MMKKLLFMLLAAVTLIACDKEDDSSSGITLSVDPPTPIIFTAAATEIFTISVVTNQSIWEAVSSQNWCKVVTDGSKFTVSADPNTSATTPTPAVITVTAGGKSVSINVTQQSAEFQYPKDETELKQAVSKVWIFPEDADYVSLEFTNDNTYTLLSKKPFTRATDNNIYLLSGVYIIADDLREFTLNDFGKINISSLGCDNVEITITPTEGIGNTVKLNEQKFTSPPISTDKKIKKVESIDSTDGNASVEYNYDANNNNRLSQMTFKRDGTTLVVQIKYEANKIWYELEGKEAIGKPGIFKVTYNLNSAGLAQSSIIAHKGEVVSKTYYTYNNQRQLISYRLTDKVGKFEAFCNATWVNGNVVSVYTERSHTCDGSYEEHGGEKYYHHDHNGDGIFDETDIMTIEKDTYAYDYSDKLNKGGYMYQITMPEIFGSSDFFDQIGQWVGVLGVSCKNVMTVHKESDGNLAYMFDKEGYPIQINVTFDEDPSDNWSIIQKYE